MNKEFYLKKFKREQNNYILNELKIKNYSSKEQKTYYHWFKEYLKGIEYEKLSHFIKRKDREKYRENYTKKNSKIDGIF